MLTVTLSARSIGCSFSKVNAGQYYFALAFYVSYIFSTPEKVWNALIDPELTKQYWVNHRNVSDWKAGSRWQHQDYNDASIVRIAGKVVESSPPHRLVVTWAPPADEGNEAKTSRVTFDFEVSTCSPRCSAVV